MYCDYNETDDAHVKLYPSQAELFPLYKEARVKVQ